MMRYTRNGINKIVYEASTYEDRKYMDTMMESDVNQLNATSTQKLYTSVLERNNVDFGDIPKAKGDIDQVKYIKSTVECLDILATMAEKNRMTVPEIAEVRTCINNLRNLKGYFTEGCKTGNEYVSIMFSCMTMACIDVTSNLIGSFLDYLTVSGGSDVRTFNAITNKDKNRALVTLESIRNFNSLYASGKVQASLSALLKDDKKNFAGTAAIATGVAVTALSIGAMMAVVPLTRELIFFFYNTRVTISDYLTMQSNLLEMNKLVVEASTKGPKEKAKIIKKQDEAIKKMRKIADKIAINNVNAKDVAKKEIKDENSLWSLNNIEKQITNDKQQGMGFTIL